MRGEGRRARSEGRSRTFAAVLIGFLLLGSTGAAQTPDSTASPGVEAEADSASPPHTAPSPSPLPAGRSPLAPPQRPSTALRRSLLVPGWGQLRNRRPARAAVAASAVAGAATYLVVRQLDYGRYRRAALYAGCVEEPDRDVCADVAFAEASWQALGQPTFAAVRPVRDAARGQRDVAGLILVAVYAVQALDAYVGAELADFDVGEDLAAPSPSGVSVRATPGGVAARLRF